MHYSSNLVSKLVRSLSNYVAISLIFPKNNGNSSLEGKMELPTKKTEYPPKGPFMKATYQLLEFTLRNHDFLIFTPFLWISPSRLVTKSSKSHPHPWIGDFVDLRRKFVVASLSKPCGLWPYV